MIMKKKYLAKATVVIVAIISVFSGCKKDVSHTPVTIKTISHSTPIPDGYTMTMVGLMPNANITVIEPGYTLSFINGHAFKVHIASGVRVKDLGTVMPKTINSTPASNFTQPAGRNASTPGFTFGNSGQTSPWVTYSEWQSSPSTPITNFTTNWTVPAAPTGNTGETFAIWMGLMPTDSTYPSPTGQQYPLIQPLLIWGNSGGTIGGGQYWTIVSYMFWLNASNQPQAAISTVVHNVAPGTVLQAQIALTGPQADGSYNCVSQFVGKTSLTINEYGTLNLNGGGTATAPTLYGLNYACEVLEIPGAPYITSVSEYPNQPDVAMNSITITTGTTHPTVTWLSSSANGLPNGATLGEHTNIVSGAEVDMYFGPQVQPPVINYINHDTYYTGFAITPLTPSNSGGTPTSYSVSPALPSGLSLNTTTGVISGTPNGSASSATYTVTATNAGGSGTFPLTITIVVSFNINFDVASTAPGNAIDDFSLWVNGNNVSGPRGVSQTNPIVIAGLGYSSTSTVVMEFTFGPMPTYATISGFWGTSVGVVSGSNITFSNVNLSTTQSVNLNIN
jgi:hypothetical protein